jgi:hypothetical protein
VIEKFESAAYVQDGDLGFRDRTTEGRAVTTRRDGIYGTCDRAAGVDDVRLEEALVDFVHGTGEGW